MWLLGVEPESSKGAGSPATSFLFNGHEMLKPPTSFTALTDPSVWPGWRSLHNQYHQGMSEATPPGPVLCKIWL